MHLSDVTPKLTLANRITIARIISIPGFVTLLLYYGSGASQGGANEYLRWSATVLFVLCSVTDALDGYIARSRNQRTRLGAILDPIADKALLLSGLVLLSISWTDGAGHPLFHPDIPVWYLIMVVSRDVLIVIGSIVIDLAVGHVVVTPRISGKISTFLQMAIIVWVLFGGPAREFLYLLVPAAVCTLISTVQYVTDGIRQLEKAHPHEVHGKPRA